MVPACTVGQAEAEEALTQRWSRTHCASPPGSTGTFTMLLFMVGNLIIIPVGITFFKDDHGPVDCVQRCLGHILPHGPGAGTSARAS